VFSVRAENGENVLLNCIVKEKERNDASKRYINKKRRVVTVSEE